MSNFTLSVRALNYLERRKIEWVGDLVVLSESALLHGKNFGRKTLNELKVAVGSLGLFLGMNVPAWESSDPGETLRSNIPQRSRGFGKGFTRSSTLWILRPEWTQRWGQRSPLW